jgi:hypothetical protein
MVAAACGGSARVSSSQTTPRHQQWTRVVFVPICYSGKMLSLSTVQRAFAERGVPLRQDAPPHGRLDWLTLRHPLPKNDYAWAWLHTVPQCSTESGTIYVKNLEITYHTPGSLSFRIKAAFEALRRI